MVLSNCEVIEGENAQFARVRQIPAGKVKHLR
jgi:hypothetical protein